MSLNLKAILAYALVTFVVLTAFANIVRQTHSSSAHYDRDDVRRYIERAADCHAEFFYTHDPSVTGVGIPDALRECDPFR